jgi:hypothetical protein
MAYSDEGACTNDAGSFFSRVRRGEIGIAGPYFAAYVAEMAWREDNQRVSNGEQYLMTAKAAGRPYRRNRIDDPRLRLGPNPA